MKIKKEKQYCSFNDCSKKLPTERFSVLGPWNEIRRYKFLCFVELVLANIHFPTSFFTIL